MNSLLFTATTVAGAPSFLPLFKATIRPGQQEEGKVILAQEEPQA